MLFRSKLKCHKKFLHTNNEHDWKQYEELKQKYNSTVKQAKFDYYKTEFENNNSIKETWDIAKECLGIKKHGDGYPDHFNIENEKVQSPSVIANKFNDFFVNVGPNLSSKIPESKSFEHFLGKMDKPNKSFQLCEVNQLVIRSVIRSFKSKKS